MYCTQSFVLAALAATGSAHMIMSNPAPFPASIGGAEPGSEAVDNSPLDVSGSNYPCKMSGAYTRDSTTEYELGGTGTLELMGAAVHGGGSCQISLTYDLEPTKQSVFKVIQSIEGGCPAKNTAGNLTPLTNTLKTPDTYDFKIPDNIPAGEVVLAWTWFNRVGNREMYMTCAPVTLKGQGGDMENFNALPDIMVANIGENKCQVAEGNDVKFPNAGASVSQFPFSSEFQDVSSQEACSYNWMAGSGPGTQQPIGGGDSGSGSGDGGAADPAAPTAPAGDGATPTSVPGGVFITKSADGGVAAPTENPAAPTTTEAAAEPTPTADPANEGGNNGGSTGGGSSGGHAEGSACSAEGTFSCAGSSYQQCASGMWSAVMPMADGTECTPGEGTSLAIVATKHKKGKRAMSFRA